MATVFDIHERKPIWQWIGEILAFLLKRALGKGMFILATGALFFVMTVVDDWDRRRGAHQSIVPNIVRDFLDGDPDQVIVRIDHAEYQKRGLYLILAVETLQEFDDEIEIQCRATTIAAGREMFFRRAKMHAFDFDGGSIPKGHQTEIAMQVGIDYRVTNIRGNRGDVFKSSSKFSSGGPCKIDCRATYAD